MKEGGCEREGGAGEENLGDRDAKDKIELTRNKCMGK